MLVFCQPTSYRVSRYGSTFLLSHLILQLTYKTSEFICNICGSYGQREFIPKNWLGNPKYLEFEGYDFPVPQEWDKYLTHMYGDYMTPKKTNFIN